MSQLVTIELFKFAILSLLFATIGSFFDQTFLFLFLVSTGFFFRYLYQLSKLDRWMRNKKKDVPETDGVWGEIFNHIYLLHKRNRNQKKKLAAALTRFQQITAALPDGVVILKQDNEIEWCNDSARRLLGIRLPHDSGQPITNLIRLPSFSKYLLRGDYLESLAMNSPANEFIFLNIRVVPYGKGQKLLLARDMTRMQRLEQARKDFIANASHELRTPLTVVNGYLEALEDDQSVELQRYTPVISSMFQQSTRMQNIVEDLLLLSRLENSEDIEDSDRVDIRTLLNEIAVEAQALSGEHGHAITVDCNCESLLVGNYKELYSAISNLAFNAVHYTPDTGKITLSCNENSDGLSISVTDTGPGIPPHHIPRLTERFYRVDNARSRETGGTGLGLAIVKHVLMRHNGRLSIESTVGKGSIFSCQFPVTQLAEKLEPVTKVS